MSDSSFLRCTLGFSLSQCRASRITFYRYFHLASFSWDTKVTMLLIMINPGSSDVPLRHFTFDDSAASIPIQFVSSCPNTLLLWASNLGAYFSYYSYICFISLGIFWPRFTCSQFLTTFRTLGKAFFRKLFSYNIHPSRSEYIYTCLYTCIYVETLWSLSLFPLLTVLYCSVIFIHLLFLW